jgi:hypothetical protein
MNPAPFLPTTHFLTPRSMTPKDGVPLTGEQISERFSTWMSPPPPSPKAITPSPISGTEREGGIEWDDVRVQSWSGTERHDNGEFIEKSVELNKAIKSMQVGSNRWLSYNRAYKTRTLPNSLTDWVPIREKLRGPSSLWAAGPDDLESSRSPWRTCGRIWRRM